MKKIQCIFLIINGLIFLSCSNTSQKNTESEAIQKGTDSLVSNIDTSKELIYQDEITKPNTDLFIVKRNSAEMKEYPDDKSMTLGMFEYGDFLNVIDTVGQWFCVKKEIERNDLDANAKHRWDSVYVKKTMTGYFNQVLVTEEEVSEPFSISVENGRNEKAKLSSYLKVELKDYTTYTSQKNKTPDLVTYDTASIQKRRGVLELKCSNKKVRLIDNIETDGVDYKEFTYIGQIKSLNKYVVQGMYFESWGYQLIDKITGKSTGFGWFPYVSPDEKYILSISLDPYNYITYIELYQIKKKDPQLIMSTCFTTWFPTQEIKDLFWGDDGYFYIPILHPKISPEYYGKPNKMQQYLRIKVI